MRVAWAHAALDAAVEKPWFFGRNLSGATYGGHATDVKFRGHSGFLKTAHQKLHFENFGSFAQRSRFIEEKGLQNHRRASSRDEITVGAAFFFLPCHEPVKSYAGSNCRRVRKQAYSTGVGASQACHYHRLIVRSRTPLQFLQVVSNSLQLWRARSKALARDLLGREAIY
ncbi:hypothetical protein CROQUDRAFT_97553 [Cronartium quercuum f. sp. fusiforme G11]|uniref:Uncharacterized protein n=1 Tax=Cronartium quercuum f. sp. fusiforme G11 TaxID=708437 RepID=A0A9P6NEW4_9BASI|nr:hypothetical protein CROQUDRAFT_97553 [Cronartium quercuum f. sp. fusiforme G11]